MSNDLTIKQASLPSAPALQQTGTNNVAVANQPGATVNFTYNINYPHMADSSAEMMIAIQSFSKEYYQLIVTCEDDVFSTGVVSVITNRALTKYNVPPEIYERCSTLTDEGIAELKRFPAIICKENTEMKGVTSPDQYCMLCYIQRVMRAGKNIKIAFKPIAPIQQLKLFDDVDPNEPTQRVNINPVKNSYAALWDEYREVQSAVPLMNVIRRILEYYFLQLCGYEGSVLRKVILVQGKENGYYKDADGNDDEEKFQLASAMLAYINASSIGMSDGMDFVEDCLNADECRKIFEMIFELMDQKQHYDMMLRK